MIYWHVEKKSVCIYSQLKRCSSSEVAAMIEGLLRHCTGMSVEKNYVDTHGQSDVAFAFCHLLGFELLPRLKGISRKELYRVESGSSGDYPNLQPILTRPINWDLIARQYDEMVKYATALRLGTVETEAILRRFTRDNLMHPTDQALLEFGKVKKTMFLRRYLPSETLRQEVHEALNVVERWNGTNGFIFFGKGGEVATNCLEDQEISVLSLHLLQIALVYVNTLMIQNVLADPAWLSRREAEDFRALTPLLHNHVNPYGSFELDMDKRLPLDEPVELVVQRGLFTERALCTECKGHDAQDWTGPHHARRVRSTRAAKPSGAQELRSAPTTTGRRISQVRLLCSWSYTDLSN